MTVGELLDELARNVLRDRSNLISGPDDNLWSDETLVRYMNEAQYRFARRSLALRVDSDDEPDVCEFALVADQQVLGETGGDQKRAPRPAQAQFVAVGHTHACE